MFGLTITKQAKLRRLHKSLVKSDKQLKEAFDTYCSDDYNKKHPELIKLATDKLRIDQEELAIHFDAIKEHFSPVGPFEVRQVELIAYCDLDIDRNRRRMASYMERAIDEHVREISPMFDADPPIDPQSIMTRAATCAYVDNKDAVMAFEQNIRLAENRRRQLIADLEHYQRQRKLRDVKDAEAVR